jgi:hypothetical protein
MAQIGSNRLQPLIPTGTRKPFIPPPPPTAFNPPRRVSTPFIPQTPVSLPANTPIGDSALKIKQAELMKGITKGNPSPDRLSQLRQYKKGGKVKKTGLALVHKGEEVLTRKQSMAKKMK